MSWNEEWQQIKAEAAAPGAARTRTNSSDAAGARPGGDLVVHQDDLGAVGNEAFGLHGRLQKQADISGAGGRGGGSTEQAASALTRHNLTLGKGLETTVNTWSSQVRTVLQMCAHISNHLDYSKRRHAEDEATIAASLTGADGSAVPVSRISKLTG